MTEDAKMSGYQSAKNALNAKRAEIGALREDMRKIQAQIEPQEVRDYEFDTQDGRKKLSDLFGDKTDLIVVHNMGAGCMYCTLWADGFNGVYEHLADRAQFVVTSPDAPSAQAKVAESRNWRFPMASTLDAEFARDMGYFQEGFGATPGVSAFQLKDGKIYRVSDTPFGPGDDFAGVWHLFALFPEGADGWQPQRSYTS
ncbi:MAG: DUF899 domain-containing protein [Neomegalonema sp.]|nr:DUF899 domain-containing protein [Neomegalonema sp.]